MWHRVLSAVGLGLRTYMLSLSVSVTSKSIYNRYLCITLKFFIMCICYGSPCVLAWQLCPTSTNLAKLSSQWSHDSN